MKAHELIDDEGRFLGVVVPAASSAVSAVLHAKVGDPDGCSEWVWVRLANGDLILGMFPQGDTYMNTELDPNRP